MRIVKDGVEYVSGRDFYNEFIADKYLAEKWREEGMPFVLAQAFGIPRNITKYLFPVAKCQAWFRGEL